MSIRQSVTRITVTVSIIIAILALAFFAQTSGFAERSPWLALLCVAFIVILLSIFLEYKSRNRTPRKLPHGMQSSQYSEERPPSIKPYCCSSGEQLESMDLAEGAKVSVGAASDSIRDYFIHKTDTELWALHSKMEKFSSRVAAELKAEIERRDARTSYHLPIIEHTCSNPSYEFSGWCSDCGVAVKTCLKCGQMLHDYPNPACGRFIGD